MIILIWWNVYRAHIFTSSGTFNVTLLNRFPNIPDNIDYLVVAGGGGGGSWQFGGGGGAGGLRNNITWCSTCPALVRISSPLPVTCTILYSYSWCWWWTRKINVTGAAWWWRIHCFWIHNNCTWWWWWWWWQDQIIQI